MSTTLAPVVKQLEVPISPAQAYDLFTEGIAGWWPLDSHRISDQATSAVFETTVGGRIYEVTSDGTELDWGDVLEVEEGKRLLFKWFPGRDRSVAGTVELTFTPKGEGCLVDLVHTGWELLGEEAANARAGYDTGWDYVLGEKYGGAACAAA